MLAAIPHIGNEQLIFVDKLIGEDFRVLVVRELFRDNNLKKKKKKTVDFLDFS